MTIVPTNAYSGIHDQPLSSKFVQEYASDAYDVLKRLGMVNRFHSLSFAFPYLAV